MRNLLFLLVVVLMVGCNTATPKEKEIEKDAKMVVDFFSSMNSPLKALFMDEYFAELNLKEKYKTKEEKRKFREIVKKLAEKEFNESKSSFYLNILLEHIEESEKEEQESCATD